MLAIQVFLALSLLLQLVDRGEIDLTQARDFSAYLIELLIPGGDGRILGQALGDIHQFVLRSRELLDERLAPDAAFLRREARLLDGVARFGNPRFRRAAPLLQIPDLRLRVLQ